MTASPVPSRQRSHFISVIIIARNEEQTIQHCLSAGIQSLEIAIREGRAGGGEVILVDSASTDTTVQKAKSFPVTILGLKDDWPLSAAAGRQMGFEHSRGDLLFFIDGDTVVETTWLAHALSFIKREGIAAIGGIVVDEVKGRSLLAAEILDQELRETPREEVAEVQEVNV